MTSNINLEKILFIDIETVSQHAIYNNLPESEQSLFQKKMKYDKHDEITYDEIYQTRASILAEFGKIICIGLGYFKKNNNMLQFRVDAVYGNNEQELLSKLNDLIERYFGDFVLCGHNLREFDLPYICRRMIINGIKIPASFDVRDKKPWEIQHYDTMQLWRFGDFKNFTSLDLLANVLQIPSPKNDITGAEVGNVYWNLNDLPRIVAYCKRDVLTTARVFQRLYGLNFITDENVIIN